jgi:cell division protein FtsL
MVSVKHFLETNQEIKEIESKLNSLKSRKSRLLQEIMEMNQ